MACYKPQAGAAIFFFELGSQTKSSPKRKGCEVWGGGGGSNVTNVTFVPKCDTFFL